MLFNRAASAHRAAASEFTAYDKNNNKHEFSGAFQGVNHAMSPRSVACLKKHCLLSLWQSDTNI